MDEKIIVYQVFTRLFGNEANVNKVDGTKAENGCGTMAAFTAKALGEVKHLGATHIWYTGLIEHATQTNYKAFGLRADHKAMVKGKAGSPYAIKDYYSIDPDLADDVPNRMREFQNLVMRTHRAGLKMIIDFVPNHVARQYHSDAKPADVADLGEGDNTAHAFDPQNNFYYIPDQPLQAQFDMQQGAAEPYTEFPAKATGNDNFSATPSVTDWYETVKLNYGVDYCGGGRRYFEPVPNTWTKMLNILFFWASKKVDGFRCDMAEMVPAEFWSWAIPQVKAKYPNVIFIAEVYNPAQYRVYLHVGHFDYLYDKVGLYDTLRAVTCRQADATAITACWQSVDDIRNRMLNFLENHDEQRIASDFFAADAAKGKPALLVSACMGTNPMMIYFGQELGERGMEAEGFSGRDGRTTIFDYWTVDSIRRWRNGGKFDGKQLSEAEKSLQNYYATVLNLCRTEPALAKGQFYDLMYANPFSENFDPSRQYAFLRGVRDNTLLIVANFDDAPHALQIKLPRHAFEHIKIKARKNVQTIDLLIGQGRKQTVASNKSVWVDVPAWGGVVVRL